MKQAFGESHSRTISAITDLANLYEKQTRYSEAEPLYVECLAKAKEVLGHDHPSTITLISNLATLYSNQGQFAQAEPLCLECVEKLKLSLGEAHPTTITAIGNLAGVYCNLGEYQKAEPLSAQCVRSRKRLYGDTDPSTISAIVNLARLQSMLGKYDDAEQSLTELKRMMGDPNDPKARWIAQVLTSVRLNATRRKSEARRDDDSSESVQVGLAVGSRVRLVGRNSLTGQLGRIVTYDSRNKAGPPLAVVKLDAEAGVDLRVRMEDLQQVDIAVTVLQGEDPTRGIVTGLEFEPPCYVVHMEMGQGDDGDGIVKSVPVAQVLFNVGTRVRVQGLENPNATKHNNKYGGVESYDERKQRYSVQLPDKTKISIKASNLRL
eukprot:c16410_g1_i1.p1 GENE.c16410_g1_i1~~c16410_g1_i1.p1  ORF type:complete len:417 (+),score=77.02 c16410_g1_i1:118-1251(+)